MPVPDPRRNSVYRMIRLVMLIDLVAGLALVAAGGLILREPPVMTAGAGLAAVGLVLFLVFGRLARRAAERG